jgi:hypothetical protein
MKEQILEIADKLRNGKVDSNEAQNLLLCLFGVSVNEVEFCICGNETGSRFYDHDKKTIECVDCGKQIQN